MNRWFLITVATATLMYFSGCGSSGESRKGSSSRGEDQGQRVPLAQIERTFNPSEYDEEIEAVRTQHQRELQRAVVEHREDSLVFESQFTQGYRIQIFASGSIDEANAMHQTAAQRLTEDSVYVVFDPPVYKVRVGDFHSRAEANQRLGVISALGFADAWVVGDKIIVRRLVRAQTPGASRK